MRLDKKELVGIFVRAVAVAAVLTINAMARTAEAAGVREGEPAAGQRVEQAAAELPLDTISIAPIT